MNTNKDIINTYVNKFGKEHVVRKAIEEMGESIQVLAKWLDNPAKVDERCICEEIAHVEVFTDGLRGIFSKETINYYYNERVQRLLNKSNGYPEVNNSNKNGK